VAKLRVNGPGKAWEESQRNRNKLYHLSLGPIVQRNAHEERKISIQRNPQKRKKKTETGVQNAGEGLTVTY